MTKIYLDVCCFNRPFDDQTQERIRLEAEAILLILKRLRHGEWHWISSEILEFEIDQTPNLERRNRVYSLMQFLPQQFIQSDELILKRGEELEANRFDGYDALHLACAERGQADVFLTTDDKLQRLGRSQAQLLHVRVDNPLTWLHEVIL